MVQRILDVMEAESINFRHYTDDRLIEADLGGQDRLFHFAKILYENIEQWTYDNLIDCKIEFDLAFERIKITY